MQKGFDIPEGRKKLVLTRASQRWRAFKTRLRKFWLYRKRKNKEKVLRKKSPWKYPWINQNDWNKFIKTYTNSDFEVSFPYIGFNVK